MTLKKYILILGLLVSTSLPLASRPLYDVFNHTSIEYSNYVANRPADRNYVLVPIDLVYLNITVPKNDKIKRFNEQMLPLLNRYFDNEGEYVKVLNDLRRQTDVYNRIINKSGGAIENSQEIPHGALPTLQSVDSEAISYVADQVFFKVEFTFEIATGGAYSYGQDLRFVVKHLYVGNLNTGKISRLQNVLTDNELDLLETRLSKRMNDMYTLVTSKLDPYEVMLITEMYEDEEDGEQKQQFAACEDICPRVFMHEAEIFWSDWGVVFNFPDFSQTSEIFGGRGFSVFVDYNEAREIFGNKEQFSFLNGLKPELVLRQNFNYWSIIESIGNFRTIPNAIEVMKANNPPVKPKKMSLKSYQVFSDSSRNYRNTTLFEFNLAGDLVKESITLERGDLYYTRNLMYDAFGRLIADSKKAENHRNESTSNTYTYDSRGNLVQRMIVYEDNIQMFNYFYNGAYVYMMENGYLSQSSERQSNQIQILNNQLCINEDCYVLNSAGLVKGVSSGKYTSRQCQMGYDEQNRLVEAHTEHDRYNYYFIYDDNNRLVQYLGFENQSPTLEVTYAYDGNSKLPKSQLKISRNGETVELEEYEWE